METKRWKAITLGRRDEGVYDDLRSVEEVAELDGDVSTAEAPLRASDVPAPPILATTSAAPSWHRTQT